MERFEHGGDIYGNTNVILDFSVSTNPFGMPEKIRQSIISRVDEFARYPDPNCRELCSAISRYENVPVDWVLCGNGAADLIYRLCYALKPKNALVCSPTFSEYERALEQVECRVTHHLLTANNQFILTLDINKMLTPDIDILFLCNPNNPTCRLIPADTLEHILEQAHKNNTTVVVDECFLDFVNNGISCKYHLKEMPRLIVLKAFTKMYAMAGLRLGYILTSNSSFLNKTITASQCWSVSVPAQIAGIAALSCEGWQEKTRLLISEERVFLSEKLSALGITVFPSDVNYILLHCELPLFELLLKKGILIRHCKNFIGLDSTYYRIGIKTREHNTNLIRLIRAIGI